MSDAGDDEPSYELQEADDEQIGRICDAFVSDFDNASALVISAVEKDTEAPTAIVETLTEILRQVETWLPAETGERFESELIPHVAQVVLAKSDDATMDAESVEAIVDFLEIVLERVARRLLYCDASLLPTLVRILDERRSFYENASIHSRREKNPFVDDNSRVSPLYLRIISHWGTIGGFTLLLRCLQASAHRAESSEDDHDTDQENGGEPTSMATEMLFSFDAIQCVYRVVYVVRDHLSREFLVKYSAPLAQSSRIYVTSIPEGNFSSLPRDKLLEIVQIVELVVAYAAANNFREQDEYTALIEEAELCVQLLRLDLMRRFFTASSLEKRIYGLVEMMDLLSKASAAHTEFYAKWINDGAILELLFGEKKHPELIKRAMPLLRFVIAYNVESASWIEAMWMCFAGRTARGADANGMPTPAVTSSSQTHEIVRVITLALLVEIVRFANLQSLQHLVNLVTESSRAVDADVIALLTAIAKRADSLRNPIVMHLWCKLPHLPKITADCAIEEIAALISCSLDEDESDQDELLDEFTRLAIECVESAGASMSVSLRLIEKIGNLARERVAAVPATTARRLVPAVLAELEQFECAFKQASCGLKAEDSDEHVHDLRERLLALRSCMIVAGVSRVNVPSLQIVTRVWDACVYKSLSNDDAAALFFQWVEYCFRTKLDADDTALHRHLLDRDVVEQLMVTKFPTLESETMSMSALSCFQHLFRKVNFAKGGVAAYTSEGVAMEDSDEEVEDDTEQVSDLLTGEPVVGLDGLWHFALYAEDQLVAEEAITLLARYHLDILPTLEGSDIAYTRKRDFIERCIRPLRQAESDYAAAKATTENNNAVSLVDRCLDCLRYFLEANQTPTKKNVPDEFTIGGFIDSGAQPMDKFALASLEQKLQLLDTYPSPMKELVSAGPNSENGTPTMLYNGPRRPSWNFKQHHAILEAIQDDCDNEVSSLARELDDELNVGGDLTLAQGIMRRGELSIEILTTERRLSIDTGVAGILRPTQMTTSPSVQARPNLQWFEGWHPQSRHGPDFVLEGMDIDPNESASSVSKEMHLPVAQLLVNWPRFFDSLFELVLWKEEATSKRAWGLLCQLPINGDILKQMVRLRPAANDDVQWSDVLDPAYGFRLLYSLRLVEALLLPSLQNQDPIRSEDAVKRQWRERFLRLGGFQHLISVLEELHSRLDMTQVDVSCFGALCRIFAYFAKLLHSPSSLIDQSSPFDSRLLHSTLPLTFSRSGEYLRSVFRTSSKLLWQNVSGEHDGITAVYATELFCAFVPHNPTLAMVELTHDDPEGIRRWLQAVLVNQQSTRLRTKVKECVVDMQEACASQNNAWVFLEKMLKAALEVALSTDASAGMRATETLPRELLDLVVKLSPHAARITDWIVASSMVPLLLMKIEKFAKFDPDSSFGNYLRVLAALSSQSGKLRDAVVSFCPSSAETGAENVPWIIDLLAHRVLWATHASPADEKCALDVETRKAAQDVIVAVVFDPSVISSGRATVVLQSLQGFYDQIQARLAAMGRPWGFRPRDELQDVTTSQNCFAGLINPGCVCYMNSLMQQLFMMPSFRNGLLTINAAATNTEWRTEIAELQKLFVSLTLSQRKALDPTEFALAHRDMDGNPTDLNVQMDADEFFCLLLDRVETCVLSGNSSGQTKPATFLDECFGGVLVNQILTENGHLSEREEKFFALSLDISQKQHLPESLSLYVQGETLDGDNAYYCEQVKKKVSATKRVCIKQLPRTLVCHLKRFEFDFDTMEKIKIHDYLSFPEEIDMYPYTSEAFATKTSEKTDETKPAMMYDLVGIVVHSGSSDMGHYYSFIKDPATVEKGHAATWFEFNDQTVKPFDVATMGEECFGGEEITQKWDHGARAYVPVVQRKRRSAYMLVYQQRELTQPKMAADWNATPETVQKLRESVLNENQELQHLVNATALEHGQFLLTIVKASLASPQEETPEEDDDEELQISESTALTASTADELFAEIQRLNKADVLATTVACQHVFGLSSLLHSDDETTIASLLTSVEQWLEAEDEAGVETRLLVCKWLLRRVIANNSTPKFGPKLAPRSWLFDVLIFCEKRLSLVQNCFSVLRRALNYVVANGRDQTAATEFLRFLSELFYEREHLDIEDPASGSQFPVPQTSIVHGVTLVVAFLNDCVTEDVKTLLLKTGFVDRFLFSLQDNVSPRRSSTSGMAPLSSRVRSCTFSQERQLLTQLFDSLESDEASVLEDPRLLMSQSLLKNMIVFDFDESLTPLILHTIHHQLTRLQAEKFMSLLLAVLEEVKSTHLEQLLGVFSALLDAEDHTSVTNTFPSVHQHIFSPTSGLMEAAAYYRDHRTLHEYAFLLVEFAAKKGSSLPRLQRYFQDNEEVVEQVSWVRDWLGSYLDASGRVRQTLDDKSIDVTDQQEDSTLEQEVRDIFRKAERAFGFSMLKKRDDQLLRVDEALTVEALDDTDDLLLSSSDGKYQDDDENGDEADAPLAKAPTRKQSLDLLRRPINQKPILNRAHEDRNSPELEGEEEPTSTFVVHAHMSSAA